MFFTVIIPSSINIEDLENLKSLLVKNKPVKIIEDASVSGHTLVNMYEFFKDYNNKITIELFAANRLTLKNIGKLTPNFNYNVNLLMDSKPIEESTLLCLKDLLFESLGTKKYRERLDLMEIFFPSQTEKLLDFLDKITKNITA